MVLFVKIYIKFGASLASKFEKKYTETAPTNEVIWDEFNIKFGANSASNLKKIYTETAPNNGAIWDEFSTEAL